MRARRLRRAGGDETHVAHPSFVVVHRGGSAGGLVDQAGLTDCVFTGPSGGNFNTAANWSCGVVPGAATHAFIDATGALVVFLNVSPVVGDLTVGVGDELSCNNNTVLRVPDATNNGVISLNSSGNVTALRIDANPTILSGAGTLRMGPNFQNRIDGQLFDIDLVNGAGHTIRGSGQIGLNVIDLVNHGLIRADQPAAALQLDLRNGTLANFNHGTLLATGGGTLTILNSGIDNALGLIRADTNSFVDLDGSTILGGDYTTSGSGLIRFTGGSAVQDLTSTAHLSVLNNVSPRFGGTIVNDALITLESSGNVTALLIETNPTTFTGTGEIVMGGNFQNRISGQSFDLDFVNDVDHVIRGSGQIGLNVIDLVNHGLIQADNPAAPLQVDLRNGTGENKNNAVMEAVNGATMTLLNSGIDNTLGLIRADTNSFVDLSGSTILGGELATVGSGLMRVTESSTLQNLASTARISILNNVTATVSGTITNQGQMLLNAVGNLTSLNIASNPTTLAGSGEVVMGSSVNNRISGQSFDIDLVNAAGHVIRGSGQIGLNVIDIVNQGLLIADDAVGMSIDQRNTFSNGGLIRVMDDGAMTIQAGPFTTSGTVQVDAGRTLTRVGNFDQTGGVTTVDGALTLTSSGAVNLSGGGILAGDGQVGGNVNNTGGAVIPGHSAGSLSLLNNYTQGAGGAYFAQIGGEVPGAGHDLLAVTGTATLAGELVVTRINDFRPTPGAAFTILTAAARVGQFDSITSCGFPVDVIYTPTSVMVVFGKDTGILGDLNGDGVVNGLDLALLLGAWGVCDCPDDGPCAADLNGSDTVNGLDLAMLLGEWG
jgi:Dockerin type I domain